MIRTLTAAQTAKRAAKTFASLARTEPAELRRAIRSVPPTRLLGKIAAGSPLGVAALTALPLFGPVGALTAAGVVVGATIGALAAVAEEIATAKQNVAKEVENRE